MFIKYAELEQIKRLDLPEMMKASGISLKTNGNGGYTGLCPFHTDKTPSLNLNIKGGTWVWHCFGCGAGGTVIDFVMKKESLSFPQAYSRLAESAARPPLRSDERKGPAENTGSRVKEPVKLDKTNLLDDIAMIYHNTLLGEDRRGLEYVERRGLNDRELIDTFRLGYANGSLKKLLPVDGALKKELQKRGILNARGNEHFYNCVVFPVTDESGQVVEFYGRSINATGGHQNQVGKHRGVFNGQAVKGADEIIITEGIIDCLSVWQTGYRNVIPLYGTSGFTPHHKRLLLENGIKHVTFALDSDRAGQAATKKLAAELAKAGIESLKLSWPRGIKDANDYFSYSRELEYRHTPEDFAGLLKKARPVKDPDSESGKGSLLDYSHGQAVFKSGTLNYHIRGIRAAAEDSMRLVITASRDGQSYTDRLDLYVAKSRRSFVNQCASRLNTQAARIEDDLIKLTSMIEDIRAEELEKAEEENRQAVPEMTKKEQEEAARLLKRDDLLKEVVSHLDAMGYVGEESNKKLAYLVATSRKLKRPLSLMLRSQSGAGKSELLEKIARLMPPEDVEFFSRITAQSLYYMGKDQLKNKLLIVDERAGSEEADYSIRNLQTRNKLTLALPLKDPATGKIKTVVLEIEGPIAYMEGSTRYHLNPENSNRCYELYLDESVEQTVKIQKAQLKSRSFEGWSEEPKRTQLIRAHQNAQRLLRPIRVIIPYTDCLTFPKEWLRTRRDHDRFLSLIEVITFLYQYQRELKKTPDGEEYIESTAADYEKAWRLAKDVLAHTLDELPKVARDLHSLMDAEISKEVKEAGVRKAEFWFSRRDIRRWTNWPYHRIKRALATLMEMDCLEVSGLGKGRRQRYRLVDEGIQKPVINGLLTPEELRRKLA